MCNKDLKCIQKLVTQILKVKWKKKWRLIKFSFKKSPRSHRSYNSRKEIEREEQRKDIPLYSKISFHLPWKVLHRDILVAIQTDSIRLGYREWMSLWSDCRKIVMDLLGRSYRFYKILVPCKRGSSIKMQRKKQNSR